MFQVNYELINVGSFTKCQCEIFSSISDRPFDLIFLYLLRHGCARPGADIASAILVVYSFLVCNIRHKKGGGAASVSKFQFNIMVEPSGELNETLVACCSPSPNVSFYFILVYGASSAPRVFLLDNLLDLGGFHHVGVWPTVQGDFSIWIQDIGSRLGQNILDAFPLYGLLQEVMHTLQGKQSTSFSLPWISIKLKRILLLPGQPPINNN